MVSLNSLGHTEVEIRGYADDEINYHPWLYNLEELTVLIQNLEIAKLVLAKNISVAETEIDGG